MKNIFRIVMAVAILFTASCAKEDISSSIGGGEVEVTFTANLTDLGTRAYGDGTTVDKVYLGIYNAQGKLLEGLTKPEGYKILNGSKAVNIDVVLLRDKEYQLVFWAQNSEAEFYSMDWENRQLTVEYKDANDNPTLSSQDEERDAFYLVDESFIAGKDITEFHLKRPFAQLRAAISKKDYEYVGNNEVSIVSSTAVVENVANVLDLSTNFGVTQVQVGHRIVKHTLIVPIGTVDHPGAVALGLLGEEVVVKILAILGTGLLALGKAPQVIGSFLKPLVFRAAVVDHQIDDHVDIPLIALGDQLLEILHGAILRIDGIVVGYVILVVGGTGMDRHQPDTVDAQFLQIVQLGDHALQVTNAVSIGVTEGVNEDLIVSTIVVVGAGSQRIDLSQYLLSCFFCNSRHGRCRLCGLGHQSRPRGFRGGSRFRIGPAGGTANKEQKCQQQAQQTCCAPHKVINP